MPLKISTILFFLNLIGCAQLPEPPAVYTCILTIKTDLFTSYGLCVPSQKVVEREKVDRRDATLVRPITEMENSVCFSPDDWKQVNAYILKLRDRAQNACQSN
jgi:hypothetical protein